MKKSYIGIFFVLLWCCASVWAYNPDAPNQFSTMERNSWEFQSLYALTKAGLTEAPLSRFDSTYTLTRMEMAQMVVKAVSNRAKGTVDQKKSIDRLKAAFFPELENLGAGDTVIPAEQTPIMTLSGDSRIRYSNGAAEKVDGRVRIQVVAAVPSNQTDSTVTGKNTDKKAVPITDKKAVPTTDKKVVPTTDKKVVPTTDKNTIVSIALGADDLKV